MAVQTSSSGEKISDPIRPGHVPGQKSLAIQVQPQVKSCGPQTIRHCYSKATQMYSYRHDQSIQVNFQPEPTLTIPQDRGQYLEQPVISTGLRSPNRTESDQENHSRQKSFQEYRRDRPRQKHPSRSSSRSRCSSRNSNYEYEVDPANDELSDCVKDLVREVKELVARSRDPSPTRGLDRHDRIHENSQRSPRQPQAPTMPQTTYVHHIPQPSIQPMAYPQQIIQPVIQPPMYHQPMMVGPPSMSHQQMSHLYHNPMHLPNSYNTIPQYRHPTTSVSQNQIENGLGSLTRSDSRRRLPDPPSGVEPVTLQNNSGNFGGNDPVQLEKRMAAIKQRVEALDKEERELDQRLKELQNKGCYESTSCGPSRYNTNGTYINMRCEQPKFKFEPIEVSRSEELLKELQKDNRSSLPESQQDNRY